MTVTRQFLRLQRTSLLVWGAILAMMVFAVASAAPAVTGEGFADLMKALGPAMQNMAGGDITRFANTVDAYVAMKLFMFLPALVGVYVVLATGAVVAREQARGTLDFLLSLPIDRGAVLRQRFLGVMVGAAILYGTIWICLVAGLESVGTPGSYFRYAMALVAALAVNMAQGGLVLVLSAALREYVQVVRWGLAFVLLGFLFVLAMQSAGVLEPVRYMLLYGFANPYPYLADGQLPWGALLVGVAGVALGLGWGGRLFARRELQ